MELAMWPAPQFPRNFFPLVLIGLVVGCADFEPGEEGEGKSRSAPTEGVHLSEEAIKSVGIVLAPVEVRPARSVLETTGWLTVRPASQVTIRAAANGFLALNSGDVSLSLGSEVATGQQLATLRPLVSPQDEAQLIALKEEADILIRQSKATLDVAEARLRRVEDLGDSGPIAGKEIEQTKETLERAQAAYEEAQQQLPFLPTEPYERPLQLEPIHIDSPQNGRILEVFVRPGQFVLQGEPLWTVADWSSLWIRVPVFEGDLSRIDKTADARVIVPEEGSSKSAKPIGVPQPTRDGRRTVDLFYEITNIGNRLRPGQAVTASLPTGTTGQRLVVPRSAVLWDGMGSSFVYVEDPEGIFRRQRIQVDWTRNDEVFVERGLAEGQMVAIVGAEAVFGEEFKGQIQALEDDD
jgi:cobalt-zinc-cadmium efflux system membrane fusion protein